MQRSIFDEIRECDETLHQTGLIYHALQISSLITKPDANTQESLGELNEKQQLHNFPYVWNGLWAHFPSNPQDSRKDPWDPGRGYVESKNYYTCNFEFSPVDILVPRGHDPLIEPSGWSQFVEHAQSTRSVFSANQICQI